MTGFAIERATASVAAFISDRLHGRSMPLVVALDGRSGAGKSTLAVRVATACDAAVVPLDDFFSASIPGAEWDAWTPAERAARVVDWPRVRAEVLVPLRASQAAAWHRFDFAAGLLPDGSYAMHATPTTCAPRPVVLLDGAYAGSPQLADLVDVAILVEAHADEREARLRAREEAAFLEAWHARWDAVEAHYASFVRSRETFDLIVSCGDQEAAVTGDSLPQ